MLSGRQAQRVLCRCLASRATTRPPSSELTTGLQLSSGRVTMNLPLPGLPGLTAVSAPLHVPVRDLVGKLRALDPSVSEVEVSNAVGQRVSGSTLVGDAVSRDLYVTLGGGTRFRVVNEGPAPGTREVASPQQYSSLKDEVAQSGTRTLREDEFAALCAKAGADPSGAVAGEWLAALESDGLATPLNKGRLVLLNPSGPGVRAEIADNLQRDGDTMGLKAGRLHKQLADLEEEDRRLTGLRDGIVARARRIVTYKKMGVLGFMTAQFGVLAYLTYEVYAWDVMEPASYFVMLTYSVGSSLYFSVKKRDATYKNLLTAALERQERKELQGRAPHLGYSVEEHASVKAQMDKYREAIELLDARRVRVLAGDAEGGSDSS